MCLRCDCVAFAFSTRRAWTLAFFQNRCSRGCSCLLLQFLAASSSFKLLLFLAVGHPLTNRLAFSLSLAPSAGPRLARPAEPIPRAAEVLSGAPAQGEGEAKCETPRPRLPCMHLSPLALLTTIVPCTKRLTLQHNTLYYQTAGESGATLFLIPRPAAPAPAQSSPSCRSNVGRDTESENTPSCSRRRTWSRQPRARARARQKPAYSGEFPRTHGAPISSESGRGHSAKKDHQVEGVCQLRTAPWQFPRDPHEDPPAP